MKISGLVTLTVSRQTNLLKCFEEVRDKFLYVDVGFDVTGMVEPTVVHCSAGIGRTGVLILMETAQCLIEANEPVYPLDVVRAMRDQRAMMIQTAVSINITVNLMIILPAMLY